MTQDELKSMLRWLDSDPEKAGQELNRIRASIVKWLTSRGCIDADTEADVVIDRVAAKVKDIVSSYQGSPAKYFYGFARNVLQECLKNQSRLIQAIPEADPFPEETVQCLEKCSEKLSSDKRYKIIEYHRYDGQEKIRQRKMLAKRFGLTLTALRIQVHRIGVSLKPCIIRCLEGIEQQRVS
jgi:hypothetical protein